MANYDYIKINNVNIIRPPDFAPQIEDVYASEIVTMSGKRLKDKIGERYSDITLSWKMLPESMVLALASITDAVTMVFDDVTGDTITQTVARTSAVSKRTRSTFNGEAGWSDVSVSFEFLNMR